MIFSSRIRRNAIKLEGERSSSLDLARGRLVLISAVFALGYIFLAARAVDLTVIQGGLNKVLETAAEETLASTQSPAAVATLRGDIFDRNGVLLATSIKSTSLFADPHLISNPQKTAEGLAKIFPELSYGDLLQKLQSEKRFLWIKRNMMPETQYKVLELGEPGLEFKTESKRVYPQGPLVSHLVGYANVDGKGQAGIERSFNQMLADDKPISLTIDVRLQHAVRRELQQAMEEFSGIGGVGIVMDVTNGEILAGVSLPDFDPHNAGDAASASIFNRLTLGVYELGSVFKIFSTAALFELKNVPMGTTFDAREPIKRGRFTINDYHAEDRVLTIPEVFMYSSNIGAAMMGEAVGTEGLKNFYKDLGLITPLEFEIKEIGAPLVPEPWREISTLTAAFGHGIATTPLQMVSAVSSIVNGGYLVKPTVVMNSAIEKENNKEQLRVVSSETAHKMRQLMRLVVTDGTGNNAEVPGYFVGGKTGTAEKIAHKGYDRKRLISSFVGAFPIDSPRYAVFMMIDEPKGTKKSFGYATGGWVAAPVVSRVIASIASIMGLQPEPIAVEQDLSASLKTYISTSGSHHD